MPIHSDEFPYDMAAWVAEKADAVLRGACRVVDWFRQMDLELSELDSEEISEELTSLIYYAAKLSAFGHENTNAWSGEWAALMSAQGHDRFLEFQQRACGEVPTDMPPSEWPLPIQRVIDLIDETASMLQRDVDDRSLVREHVLRTGNALVQSRLQGSSWFGNSLLELIDDQAVHAAISWSDFIRECDALLAPARESFVQQAEKSLEPWA